MHFLFITNDDGRRENFCEEESGNESGRGKEKVAIDTEVFDNRTRQNEIMTKMISSGVELKKG